MLFPIAGISSVLQIYVGLEIFEKHWWEKATKEARECARGAALTLLWAQKWSFSTFVILPSWKFICRNRFPFFLLGEMSPWGSSGQGWECVWILRLRMWDVLVSPALLGAVFVSLWHFGVSQGTAEGPWQLPEQSLGRSWIDPERLKLSSLSHFQPPFSPSLRKFHLEKKNYFISFRK